MDAGPVQGQRPTELPRRMGTLPPRQAEAVTVRIGKPGQLHLAGNHHRRTSKDDAGRFQGPAARVDIFD